jgi:protein tyrosine/serine phosphatase
MAFDRRKFTRNAAIISAGVVATVLFVVNGVIPNFVPKNFDAVEPRKVYRSGELTSAAMKRVLEDHDITLVIDLGAHHAGSDGSRREARTVELLGARRVLLPLFGDGTGDPNRYVEALRQMQGADGPVLVHCAAGAQRTGVAIALYRMIEDGWSMDDALMEAQNYGYDPADNPKLRAYLERWAAAIVQSLKTGEPIPYDGPSAEME